MKETTWKGILNPNHPAFASGSSELVDMLFWRWVQAQGCRTVIAQAQRCLENKAVLPAHWKLSPSFVGFMQLKGAYRKTEVEAELL